MHTSKELLKQELSTATHQIPADLVIKNARILDVFNLEWMDDDVAITNGKIVGIGSFEGKEVIDAEKRYLCPSFIDGHVHIESSMVPPSEFAKIVLPHGVTTVITDPHEIANVSGTKGLEFMMKDAEQSPLDVFFMLPSSVPATPQENSGAVLKAEDLRPFLQKDHVLGLAEVMDYPSLKNGDPDLLQKIIDTGNRKIDGHLAGLPEHAVNLYRTAGIDTDHECSTAEEAKERLRRGMYLLLREGSVAKNLRDLLPVVTAANARRCLFCTDDKHLDDLIDEGSIDHHIRLAIQSGLSAEQSYQMASLNAAECYGLKEKGAIAPGFDADFLFIDDLEKVKISEVFKAGKRVRVEDKTAERIVDNAITSSIHVQPVTNEQLQIPIGEEGKARVIEINPNQIFTNKLVETVDVTNGYFVPSTEKDQLKMVVVERHKQTGNVGTAIVKGFGFKYGAMATTIAHDSHNIVAAGTNDKDLLKAIETLKEIKGGLVVVKGGKVVTALPLTIAGLMSEEKYPVVYKQIHEVERALQSLEFTRDFNPFLTLSFLTLPVIPEWKLTDRGLFDVKSCAFLDVSL